LALLQQADEEAWADAFRLLWPVVLRAARLPAACLTAGEAEEVASEALSQLVRRVETVASMDELKALAATIAHRRAISTARAKSAAKRGLNLQTLDALGCHALASHDSSAAAPGVLSDLELSEMALLLRQALDGLDTQTRALLRAKIVDGLSYQQLSAEYQMPLGTVCAKVSRALKQIRRRLAESPVLMKELTSFLR
jgi:RNA polymerase sigma factor (sigma-70 family)